MVHISYDKPIVDLVDALSATGHVTHQVFSKTGVTFHHNGGVRASHQDVLNTWKTRKASAHFDVDADGRIAQYVKYDEFAWSTGDEVGNEDTISIEMADISGDPKWEVSANTMNEACRLAAWLFVHVIGAPPSAANVFMHKHWTSTDCPGPFIDNNFHNIILETQKQYDIFRGATPRPPVDTRKSINQIASEVIRGDWGNGEARVNSLRHEGYDPVAVQAEVNRLMGVGTPTPAPKPGKKSVKTMAKEVINGDWGNGADRVSRLTKAGYNAADIQAEVNRQLA